MRNTPLAWAAEGGHGAVVKMLLERDDVDPNKPGEGGQTPLFLAARAGHEELVKLFLRREDINPDKPDDYG